MVDDKAFPQKKQRGIYGGLGEEITGGLTKKELFAGMALMGILASGEAKSPASAVETAWHYANDMMKGDVT